MRKLYNYTILKVLLSLVLFVIFAGCRTLPVSEDSNYFAFLSSNNDIYLSLNVSKNKSTLSAMIKKMSPEMKDNQIEQILSRTQNLYVGIKFDDKNQKQIIELCAKGSFPAIMTSALTKNKGWTKEKAVISVSGKPVKHTAYVHTSGISLAIPAPSVLFLSTNTVEPLINAFYNPKPLDWPQYALEKTINIRDDEKVKAYVPNPGVLLPKIIGFGVQLALDGAIVTGAEVYVPGKTSQFLADIDLFFKDARAVKASSALLKLATVGSGIEIIQLSETQLTLIGIVISIDTLLGMKF